MGALNFILSTAIVSLAVFAGYFTAKMAKEELAKGNFYFRLAEKLLFSFIIYLFLAGFGLSTIFAAVIALVALVLLFVYKHSGNDLPFIAVMGIANGLLKSVFFSAVAFVYLFVIGTLLVKERKSKILAYSLMFFVLSLPAYFI